MHIEHSSKMSRFFASGGGSAAPARLPIAKAKATPHAMRSNMPGIRCLVHRQPPTRTPCFAASGLTAKDLWQSLVGCLLGKTRIFVCFGLLGWAGPYHIRNPCFWKLAPNFHDTGLETEARFPATPPSGNRAPI